ncbi:uncharacterized protein LOC105701942 [Orussus abietinus]|uniref:uncharacterized protein LOC105701942 n=1 Tax=Orussus abietinus TaxID=222816 RepID=UPI0006264877|nr:uncharacterized protein LOC105701942 [Orussus abietinus]
MYKTVRKGDASLQYTILPQTDQFSASGFPQSSSKSRPKILKYTMGTLMVIIMLSCIATPFLMNQNDHNLFANTVLAMDRQVAPKSHHLDKVGHAIFKNSSKPFHKETSIKEKIRTEVSEKSRTETERRKIVHETTTQLLGKETSNPETTVEDKEEFVSAVPPESSLTANAGVQETSSRTSTKLPSTTSSSRYPTSPRSKMNIYSELPRKLPRVTLKLRENETIPQMYMKAGIASYKKGNITTSVLAHGLSLEGLIFKTPEGTMKPWPRKWPFTDASSYFQWKKSNQMPMMIYIVLASLAALACVSIVLMFYVQRKVSRRQRQSVEEPEAEGHEEDKSTLLGETEKQEADNKE